MKIEADVSLYPLGEEEVIHPVHDFWEGLKKHGCTIEHCQASTLVAGESNQVFEAVRLGYEEAVQKSGCVLIMKISNACPL